MVASVRCACLPDFRVPSGGSCLTTGPIDASENNGTGRDFNPAVTTGVVCCQEALDD